ncbi:MAG: response regulator [Chitinophagales bacterium]
MKHKKQVLIIDDDQSTRMLLGCLLSRTYNIATQKNGLEAMAWLGNGNIPDVILLDVHMPQLNGPDFLQNIRTSGFYRDIPVIVVSGTERDKMTKRLYELGTNDFVHKPFKPKELFEKIENVLTL